jgi:hypothetical protein
LDKVTAEEMALLTKLKPLHVARAVVSAIAACGVPTLVLGFVIGSTRETVSSLAETAARAEEFSTIITRSSGGRTTPVVLPLCSVPLPGTPDFRSFRDNIAYPADQYPEFYNIFMSVLHTSDFTPLGLTQRRRYIRDMLNPASGTTAAAAPVPRG